MSDQITVIGSLNRDTVVRVSRIPAPGETVLGTDVGTYRGGKGANQALAAARLGRPVSLIGRVGADGDGTSYLRALVAEGVDVEGVSVDIDVPTGQAFVFLGEDAENAIAVIPGANGNLSAEDVAAASDLLDRASVALAQLEVPLDAVKAAAQLCRGTFVLNPAPAKRLGQELLSRVDVIVPNRSELALLVGEAELTDVGGVIRQARRLRGPGAVVVTMGGEGAVLVNGDRELRIPAPEVDAVDTTGAGDAFCAALADALARGEALEEAVRWAVAAGAAAVTRVGAQTALPTADQVRGLAGG
jgi:ribokinase